jgi:hypothetical protein
MNKSVFMGYSQRLEGVPILIVNFAEDDVVASTQEEDTDARLYASGRSAAEAREKLAALIKARFKEKWRLGGAREGAVFD